MSKAGNALPVGPILSTTCALVKLPKWFVVRWGIVAKEFTLPPLFHTLSELDGPRLSTNVVVLR